MAVVSRLGGAAPRTAYAAHLLRWSPRQLAVTLVFLVMLAWAVLSLGEGAGLVMAANGLLARPDLVLVFLLTYTLAFCLRAVAWQVLLPGNSVGVGRLFSILQVALMANHLFPTKVGEVVRGGLLAKRGVSVGAATSSTLLARLMDLAALCLIALAVAPIAGGRFDALFGLLALPGAIIAVGAFGCYLIAAGKSLPLSRRVPARVVKIAREARASLAIISRARLVAAFAIVVPSWLLEAGALWSVAQAADVPLPLVAAIVATAFTIAFQGFQVTPGGLGVYEASLTGALMLYGLDPAVALALAVATHALKFAYSYLFGLPCLVAEGLSSLGPSSLTRGPSDSLSRRRFRISVARGNHETHEIHEKYVGNENEGGASQLHETLEYLTQKWSAARAAPLEFHGFVGRRLSIHHSGVQPGYGLAVAGLACMIFQAGAWTSFAFWPGFIGGLLATVPVAVLGRCHHLPGRLSLCLLAVPLVFFSLFGAPAPLAGVIALAIATMVAISQVLCDNVARSNASGRRGASGGQAPALQRESSFGAKSAERLLGIFCATHGETSRGIPMLFPIDLLGNGVARDRRGFRKPRRSDPAQHVGRVKFWAGKGIKSQKGIVSSFVPIFWPLLLTQSIAAGVRETVGVAVFCLVMLFLVVLVRQWWLARQPLDAPGPPLPGSILAVVIPVHNEAAAVAPVVARVPRARLKELGFETQVIVVDDGSTDGSEAIARTAGADIVISHPKRRGLGAAVRTGLATAHRLGAGGAVYLDGDGEYDPSDIPNVAGPVLRGEADYVLGSRFPYAAPRMCLSRRLGNQMFTAFGSLLCGKRLRDGQTGFRAFSARALANAEIVHDYNYAQVLTLDLVRKRMRLAQVPINYRTRRHGKSFIRYHEYLRRVLPAILREVLGP
ncbi:MAG: flippase-like domain-containing protein [Chloroflexi bacterium]|nr:flippase-like domain-containing protein [Chloroflexota bacterium]